MNLCEMFNTIETVQPTQECFNSTTFEPEYVEQAPKVNSWSDEFKGFASTPVLYNMDGYIGAYPSSNWGSTSPIIQTLVDDGRLPALDNKIDPNKIFNSDTSALRTLAADQNKATKLFEKKFFEGLNDRGKVGLNEMDIMAMQALTAARSAVTSIQKEQIGIKKNIADIKIKQQQNATRAAGNAATGNSNVPEGNDLGINDIGRSILDNIFNAPGISTDMNTALVNNGEYQEVDLNSASSLLDNITSMTPDSHIQFEQNKPTTYVVVGDNDDEAEFVTYGNDGSVLTDYPNPTAKINTINRDSNTATDELLIEYPVKYK